MASITFMDLQEGLPFGARISGIDLENVADRDVRGQLNEVFSDRGLIVFENVEPSVSLQVELSKVFGPLQEHAIKDRVNADENTLAGLIDLNFEPGDTDIFEVDGQLLAGYLPWHFDATYVRELNRGGILRALAIPPEGGTTGFADGVQLYDAISPDLRDRFEDARILYHSSLVYSHMRFGMPASYREITLRPEIVAMFDKIKNSPRAVHPAIWRRESGEKVLHVSPWQAAGIEGFESEQGDALLEALIQEIYAKMQPYRHAWKPSDMIIWDNWRFLHSVSGHKPEYSRRVQRTTIKGDYGLGSLEGELQGSALA